MLSSMFDAAVINFVVFIFGIMLLQAFYHLEAGREHPTFSITSEMPWAYLIESSIMTSATWSARDMLPDKCLSLGAKTVTIWFSNSLFWYQNGWWDCFSISSLQSIAIFPAPLHTVWALVLCHDSSTLLLILQSCHYYFCIYTSLWCGEQYWLTMLWYKLFDSFQLFSGHVDGCIAEVINMEYIQGGQSTQWHFLWWVLLIRWVVAVFCRACGNGRKHFMLCG